MGNRYRSTPRPTWLTWDNYLIGALGLIVAAALGTVAATVALAEHYVAALALAVFALAFAVPAGVQIVGELLAALRLIGMIVAAIIISPALLVSPSLRRRAKRRFTVPRR
ncbi:hypothetical protein [Nocardia sp. NPDC005366]|uniref:hypothetical protein n=1 Tax=Nocardia sp. NPDC005366 TaxID=3156878 RepID=UPI00339E71F4